MTISWGEHASQLAYNVATDATFRKPSADAAAGTATAETAFFQAPVRLIIEAVEFVPSAALNADAANNATLTIVRRNADGTGNVTVASLVTDVAGGSWTQWVAKLFALSGTVANLELAEGQILTFTIGKSGTGVVVPSGVLLAAYRRH